MRLRNLRRRASGFTLLELVVVVGIMVLLAGLVLPNLDLFKQKANKAMAAHDMADVSRSIMQTYAQNANYSDKWDSLMAAGGTGLWTATLDANNNLTPGLDSELPGAPVQGSPHKLTNVPLPTGDGYVRSLTRVGIRTLLDVNASTSSASEFACDCFTEPRTISTTMTGDVATINTADDDGKAIIKHYYPTSVDAGGDPIVPADKFLLVVGVGPLNTMLGSAVQEIPIYPNRDPSIEYCRFLAVFEVDAGGAPAHLKGVLGADGDSISSETAEYYAK